MTKQSDVQSWPEGHRRCVECRELKPFSAFHKHSGCKYGVNTVCKPCRKPSSQLGWQRQSLRQRLFHRARSRATVKGIPFTITVDDIVIPDVCPVFGKPFELGHRKWGASIDKMIPELGYVKGNISVISNLANMMKSSATLEELRTFGRWACEIL